MLSLRSVLKNPLRMDGVDLNNTNALAARRRLNLNVALGHLLPLIDKEANILDADSGNGDLAVWVAEQCGASSLKMYDVVSPDENTQSIASITMPNTGYLIHFFDSRNIPESDHVFDLVTCIFVLHHAGPQDQIPLIKELVWVGKIFLLITEDANEPEFEERNRMHNINGKFRTHAEWVLLWEQLGLDVVAEGDCIPDQSPLGPQKFYLL